MRKLKFKLVRNVIPLYGTSYTTCIGCDFAFNEMLNIKEDCIRQTGRSNYTVHNNTSSSTLTSNTSQNSAATIGRSTQRQQLVPSSNISGARPVQANNTVTSSISDRRARNHSSNVSKSSRLSTVNRNTTITDNRENTNPWDNANDWENKSDQTTSRNSRDTANRTNWGDIDGNAEIMCNCHETAIQLTVRKEGPNKGNIYDQRSFLNNIFFTVKCLHVKEFISI